MQQVILSWSGGKESALALYELRKSKNYQIIVFLTALTRDYDRTSLHGVRRILLEKQADSLGIPLEKIFITKNASNEEYESKMREILEKYLASGVSSVVFGDVFLEDIRKYREENLAKIGMKAIFPIWKKDTLNLAHKFIDLGYKAVITCIDSNILDKKSVGRIFDKKFLSELPPGIDPCGENGEFHSFVYDGPIFKKKIRFKKGNIVLRNNRFYYCDLLPV